MVLVSDACLDRDHPHRRTDWACAAVYLAVITATNTANVAFFAQSDSSLKGSAMAFQFLLASLCSCRLVLSLRDSEALAVTSAAASLATKSFWKTGFSGENEQEESHRAYNQRNGTFDIENSQSFPMQPQHSDRPRTGAALPTYVEPIAVQ